MVTGRRTIVRTPFPFTTRQVDYFSGLVDQLNTDIAQWVSTYQKTNDLGNNIGFVNLANVDHGYQWCDDKSGNLSPSTHNLEYREPYAYGFSVNGTSTSLARYPAPAIFHPTITGQQQIAACVKPAIRALVGNNSSSARSHMIPAPGPGPVSSLVERERTPGPRQLLRARRATGGVGQIPARPPSRASFQHSPVRSAATGQFKCHFALGPEPSLRHGRALQGHTLPPAADR